MHIPLTKPAKHPYNFIFKSEIISKNFLNVTFCVKKGYTYSHSWIYIEYVLKKMQKIGKLGFHWGGELDLTALEGRLFTIYIHFFGIVWDLKNHYVCSIFTTKLPNQFVLWNLDSFHQSLVEPDRSFSRYFLPTFPI